LAIEVVTDWPDLLLGDVVEELFVDEPTVSEIVVSDD